MQEEFARKFHDHSLFAFSASSGDSHSARRLLATSPSEFAECNRLENSDTVGTAFIPEPYRLTNDGLHIDLPLVPAGSPNRPVDLALLNYQVHGSPIGLVLRRNLHRQSKRHDVRYIVSTPTNAHMYGVHPLPLLGAGVVSLPREIAITARRESILIRDDDHLVPYHRRRQGCKTWLRYDLALQYESASPGCVLADTVAKQQDRRPPHMIHVSVFDSSPFEVAVFRFSQADFAIIVALSSKPRNDLDERGVLRGALLVTTTQRVDNEEQLLALGTDLVNDEEDNTIAGQIGKRKRIASALLKGHGYLELWHETYLGDWISYQRLVTLSIREFGGSAKSGRLLCDGTRDRYEADSALASSAK